jgi:tetratricopeptide (TPR) repeat protein
MMENNRKTAEEYYNRSLKKYSDGDLLGSINDLDQAIKNDSEYAEAFLRRAKIKNETGDLLKMFEAFDDYSKYIELRPDDIEGYIGRGAFALALSDDNPDWYNQAMSDLDEAQKIDPKNHLVYFNKGIADLNFKEYESMIGNFTEVISLEPDYGEAYYFRGVGKNFTEDFEGAILDFTSAIKFKCEQNYLWAFNNRAVAYSNIGEYKLAEDDFRKALEIKPDLKESLSGLAEILVSKKDYLNSINLYSKILESNPDEKEALEGLGRIYHFQNRYEEAKGIFLKLSDLYPTESHLFMNIGSCLTNQKKHKEAVGYFNKAIQLSPEWDYLYYCRGVCYLSLNDDRACEDLWKAYDLGFEEAKNLIEKHCPEPDPDPDVMEIAPGLFVNIKDIQVRKPEEDKEDE